MTTTLEQLAAAHAAARKSIDLAFDMAGSMVEERDQKIADLMTATPGAKIGTVYGINGNRTGKNGITRTPSDRRYYQPGKFPVVPDTAFLASIEEILAISYKLPPAEVLAGKWNERIISWHKAAKAKLPKLLPGYFHKSVPWHEPASEIEAGVFTGDQHAKHVVHIAKLLHDAGLSDTFIVCPNYTMGPAKSGANFNTAWLPDADEAPAGSLMISGDLYDNPYGGGALTSPYHDPHEDLDVLAKAAKEHGFSRVAVLELGAPRRTHDATGVKRVEYFQNFVEAARNDYPDLNFDSIHIWEGVGKWDQRLTLPNEWAFVAKLLASSPRTRA